MELQRAYKEPSSLIMSGVESDSYWDIAISAGIEKVLVSYHYIQKKGMKFIRERLAKAPNVKLMVDSGAYTFHTNPEQYKEKPMEWWETYVTKYTNTIKKNADIIFSCVNLDVANFIGQDSLDRWDKQYFQEIEDAGVLVCRVWHEFDGKKMWEEMCKKYNYVGFSLAVGDIDEAQIAKMFLAAKKYNTLVHGFAITRVDLMSRMPFYTGDSTTWLVGTQYGELNWFDGRVMKRLKKDKWKRHFKMKFIKLGANWELAEKENPYELIRINLLVFKEAEKYIRARIRFKQYWMKSKGIKAPVGEEKKPMSLFKRPAAPAAPKEIEKPKIKIKPKGTNFQKGVQDRSDLAAQGMTKFDEFQAAQKAAEKPKPLIKPKVRPAPVKAVKTPTRAWFSGEMEDYKEYATSCNINPELEQSDICDVLWDMYVFLTPDEEELDKITDEELSQLADFHTEVSTEDRDEAITNLKMFYENNVLGLLNTFNSPDEDLSEDAPPPRPIERETYLTDEETEIVDVSPEEIGASFGLALPSGESMDEVAAYDAELSERGIVAVRDSKGKFLKGQKVVRKPKSLYSDKFPKLACNTCYKAGECPEFKPDHACAFEKIFNKFDTRSIPDILDAMTGIANLSMGRMMRTAMFEQMDGGMPDQTLTAMVDQNLKVLGMMKQLHESQRNTSSVVAQQTTRVAADGSREVTTTVHNPSSGGILERIFMNSSAGTADIVDEDEVPNKREVIDVTE